MTTATAYLGFTSLQSAKTFARNLVTATDAKSQLSILAASGSTVCRAEWQGRGSTLRWSKGMP